MLIQSYQYSGEVVDDSVFLQILSELFLLLLGSLVIALLAQTLYLNIKLLIMLKGCIVMPIVNINCNRQIYVVNNAFMHNSNGSHPYNSKLSNKL